MRGCAVGGPPGAGGGREPPEARRCGGGAGLCRSLAARRAGHLGSAGSPPEPEVGAWGASSPRGVQGQQGAAARPAGQCEVNERVCDLTPRQSDAPGLPATVLLTPSYFSGCRDSGQAPGSLGCSQPLATASRLLPCARPSLRPDTRPEGGLGAPRPQGRTQLSVREAAGQQPASRALSGQGRLPLGPDRRGGRSSQKTNSSSGIGDHGPDVHAQGPRGSRRGARGGVCLGSLRPRWLRPLSPRGPHLLAAPAAVLGGVRDRSARRWPRGAREGTPGALPAA